MTVLQSLPIQGLTWQSLHIWEHEWQSFIYVYESRVYINGDVICGFTIRELTYEFTTVYIRQIPRLPAWMSRFTHIKTLDLQFIHVNSRSLRIQRQCAKFIYEFAKCTAAAKSPQHNLVRDYLLRLYMNERPIRCEDWFTMRSLQWEDWFTMRRVVYKAARGEVCADPPPTPSNTK